MSEDLNVQLVCIDMQRDFCHPDGALYVPGAEDDVARLADFVRRATPVLDDVHVTLDSHQRLHIAHPEFVVDENGEHPETFTVISLDDAKSGKFRASRPKLQDLWLSYLESLESSGRYAYCIWPPHCIIGTEGHALMPEFVDALERWALRRFATVDYLTKGSNWRTEHYSAVVADVPDPADPSTQLNMRFIQPLEEADVLIWAGQASTHCVPNTYRDVADAFGNEEAIQRMVLLEDCQSPVPGFEDLADAAISDMESRGMRVMTSTELLKELTA